MINNIENQILLGDCLDILKELPDKSIDFICIDPPYNMIATEWDKNVINLNLLWTEFERIRKESCVVCVFGSQPFTTKLISSNIKNFKYCWYWIKNQGTNFFHTSKMPIRKIEEICVFYSGSYNPQFKTNMPPTNSATGCSNGKAYHGKNKRNYVGGKTERYPTNILEFKCVDNYSRVHTSQKPIELIEYLIKTYTKDGDLILDCFAGSGTTGLTAKNLNRKYFLVENNQKYYDLSYKLLTAN